MTNDMMINHSVCTYLARTGNSLIRSDRLILVDDDRPNTAHNQRPSVGKVKKFNNKLPHSEKKSLWGKNNKKDSCCTEMYNN